jgi:hypothetical protein
MKKPAGGAALGIKERLSGPEGFVTPFRFMPEELETIRSLIRAHWLERIWEAAPQHAERFAAAGIERYHELSHLLDHEKLWTVKKRVLPMSAVTQIRRMSVFSRLEEEFGPFQVADVEHVSEEEMVWRIVRPGGAKDIGPLHADAWFWDIGDKKMPIGMERVKVWVAVHCEPGLSGLKAVAGSHLREWRRHNETRAGLVKPRIDEDEASFDARLLRTEPGDVVVFNDKLLHAGAPTKGERTRISLEFTLFVRKES